MDTGVPSAVRSGPEVTQSLQELFDTENALDEAGSLTNDPDRSQMISESIHHGLNDSQETRETLWPFSDSMQQNDAVAETVQDSFIHAALQWLVRFLIAWQSQVGLSDRALQMLINFLSSFSHVLAKILPSSDTLARLFPKSVLMAKHMQSWSSQGLVHEIHRLPFMSFIV